MIATAGDNAGTYLRAFGVLALLCALLPWSISAILFLISWRLEAVIGHWPMPTFDDPKVVAPGDEVTSALFVILTVVIERAVSAVAFLPVLMWMLRPNISSRLQWAWMVIAWAIYLAGWAFLLADPARRLEWFLD